MAGADIVSSLMAGALAEAEAAGRAGEVPVGCLVFDPVAGRIVARGHNRTLAERDPTAHAEIVAIRRAARLGDGPRLAGLDLYVTLEPCVMCAGAILQARLRRVYYGAEDPRGGALDNGPCLFHRYPGNHRPEVYGGIGGRQAASLLRAFFRERRRGGPGDGD